MSPVITRLTPQLYSEHVPALAEVLADVVAHGASVGFRKPFAAAEAAAWWRSREPAVRAGDLHVWAVHGPAGLAGTVSLVLEPKANGRHRAEVVKLMVHSRDRGRGLGRALLDTAERAAAAAGATLLLLDTVTGSPAERLYETAGWTRFGIVPGYATDPDGTLEPCSFFYKRLEP
ncbi:GNAT family N-acetyltransferase [Dactylosporangium matsuzakiense]|uniref:N-acetyltransferase n=1 Tax=Dactylosporangium matsuzakiense TaxID=53360 RepID=A0A9W6KSB3_9ACTN|nr:GNAT family N-acetyltransferase [Dactylosporangium matsuzakiense]UWZ41836.1 GNAT family N-acetyltransferase [Dactylosporangium matsuzakiense]GLL05510.1 N-acetyltransferase [Dactylosporangium matsuzakiense]